MSSSPIIDVVNLKKSYKNKEVVKGISFSVNAGNVLALLGPNGAGKTTTIKMLLGLITPDSGIVRIAGHDMTRERSLRQGLKQVGAVLEGARNSYWRLSARENLFYFGGLRGIPRRELRTRAEEVLQYLGLADVADREVRTFSRGMQQKLAIGIALFHKPAVLMLDEPTLGLDVPAARTLEEKIAELAEQGIAIIITTHTMHLAEKLASHVFVINQGERVAYGEQKTLIQDFRGKMVIDILLESNNETQITNLLAQEFPTVQLTMSGEQLLLTWHEPTQADVLQLLGFLDKAGYAIAQMVKRQPTLEEVFLTLINHK